MSGNRLRRLLRDMKNHINDSQLLLARFEDLMRHGYPPTDVEELRVEIWAMRKIADWLGEGLDEGESEDEE
ncbi:MAG TPA: hypothetical protein PLY87_10365 [Planctomycetaceae bacterium]|nr:hypothetical protein [Planctomycetaceae bacterium]